MRNLYLLVIGNSVSTLGSSVYLIVVVLLLKDLTDSGVLLGLYQFLALLPAALLLPVTGALVDRLSRRAIVIGADLFRGAVMIGLSLLWIFPELVSPLPLLLVSFLVGAGNALFVPAVQALIPELVPSERLEQANGLRGTTNQLSNLAGNAVGGVAYALLSAPVIFLANGLSFLLSAAQEWAIELPGEKEREAHPGAERAGLLGATGQEVPESIARTDDRLPSGGPPNLLNASREGILLVSGNPPLRRLILSQVGLFLISPPVLLSLPFLVEDRLGQPEWLVGVLFAAMLGGAVVAFLLTSRRSAVRRSRIAPAYALMGLALLSVPLLPSLATLFLAASAAGAAAGVVYIEVASYLQRLFPRGMHGRLFATIEAGNAILAPTAYLLSGVLIDLLTPRVELTYLVAALPTLLWAFWLWRSAGATPPPET
ncbi:MAG: MFS transporter [Alkalispirochaetaceae bacterium]